MSEVSQAEMIAYLYRREEARERHEQDLTGYQLAVSQQSGAQSQIDSGLFSQNPQNNPYWQGPECLRCQRYPPLPF